jgi:hypothetical protein
VNDCLCGFSFVIFRINVGGSRILRNGRMLLPNYTASHHRRHILSPSVYCVWLLCIKFFFFSGATATIWPGHSHFSRLHDHTQTHHTRYDSSGRDQPDAGTSTLTTHNIHKRQTSMPPAVFEPATPVSERPQTHAVDRAATGLGCRKYTPSK